MKTQKSLLKTILPALLVVFMAGCDLIGKEDPKPGTLTIAFSNQINGQDLVLEEQNYAERSRPPV